MLFIFLDRAPSAELTILLAQALKSDFVGRCEVVVKRLKTKGPWALSIVPTSLAETNQRVDLEFVEGAAAALARESGRGVWLALDDAPFDVRAVALDERGRRRWTEPSPEELESEALPSPFVRLAKDLKAPRRALDALKGESTQWLGWPRGLRFERKPPEWTTLETHVIVVNESVARDATAVKDARETEARAARAAEEERIAGADARRRDRKLAEMRVAEQERKERVEGAVARFRKRRLAGTNEHQTRLPDVSATKPSRR